MPAHSLKAGCNHLLFNCTHESIQIQQPNSALKSASDRHLLLIFLQTFTHIQSLSTIKHHYNARYKTNTKVLKILNYGSYQVYIHFQTAFVAVDNSNPVTKCRYESNKIHYYQHIGRQLNSITITVNKSATPVS